MYKEKKYLIHPAWIILSIGFINLFLNYGIRLGYSIVLPEMIGALNLGRRQAGDIYNAYLLTYIIASPFTGYLTDKFGARRIISLFAILLGFGTVLMGTTKGLLSASVSFAFVGMGASAMWTPILTVIQRWFSPNKRGMALGILSTGIGVGFGVLGYLYPVIIRTWNWRFCWYIPGTAALLMVFINVGMLLGALISSIKKEWKHALPIYFGLEFILMATGTIFALTPFRLFLMMGIILFIVGITIPILNTIYLTIMQLKVPADKSRIPVAETTIVFVLKEAAINAVFRVPRIEMEPAGKGRAAIILFVIAGVALAFFKELSTIARRSSRKRFRA